MQAFVDGDAIKTGVPGWTHGVLRETVDITFAALQLTS